MSVIDTHCHLDLMEEKGISQEEAVRNAAQAGVCSVIQIAVDLESSERNKQLSETINHLRSETYIHWTAGLHPCNVSKESALLGRLFDLIRENRANTAFIGIGETGLDYFHEDTAHNDQKESFQSHVKLAAELELPLILHLRDDRVYTPGKVQATHDALEIVKNEKVKGVLHCYTYTEKEALPFVELGWFISYSGVLTFSNAGMIQDGATRLPLDCLLVETDAPYLAPVPYRGQVNQPSYVVHTLEFLANLRAERCGETPETVKKAIYENSKRFLNLKNRL